MVTRRHADGKPKLLLLHNRAGHAAGSNEVAPDAEPHQDDAALEHLRALAAGLGESGFEVALVDAEDDNQRITHAVVVEQPSLVFLVDNFDGEVLRHPSVASLLELHGLTYAGSDPLCLSTCRDRVRTHLMLADAEVPVPPHVVVRDVNAIPDTAEIEPPYLIVHALDHGFDDPDEGSIARTRDEVEDRAGALAAAAGLPILVEQLIEGRRIHAVVLGNRVLEVLPLAERVVGPDRRLGPARIAQLEVDTADAIRALAQRAFRVMGCRDSAQVEFAIDRDGRPCVLSVNPVYDMFPDSAFVVGASASELGVAGAVAHLADIALERVEAAPPEPALISPEALDEALGAEHEDAEAAPAATQADGPDPASAAGDVAAAAPVEASADAEPGDAAPAPAPSRAKPPTPRRKPASRSRPRSSTAASPADPAAPPPDGERGPDEAPGAGSDDADPGPGTGKKGRKK